MNFSNSVGTRIMLGFAGVIIVLGAAVALSVSRLSSFNTGLSEVSGPELAKVVDSEEWSASIAQTMVHSRNLLLVEDKAQLQAEIDETTKLAERRKQFTDAMMSNVHSTEEKALLQAVLGLREVVIPLGVEYLRQIEAGDLKGARETLLQRLQPTQNSEMVAIRNLAEQQKERIRATAKELAASYASTRLLVVGLSLAAIAVACAIAFLIIRAIRRPLEHALNVLGEIEKGNYSSTVSVNSKDEIGQTLRGLERMQLALRDRTDKEHAEATENARIRTALDRVSTGVMLADVQGNVIYANEAVIAIFRSRTSEVRKQLPNFDAERILGSSIDDFHRAPAHQRHLLSTLTGTHTVDIKMGDAVMRAVLNSVSDADGKRVGSVVQWVDRTQEVATEDEMKAVVAKAIDGDLTARIREEGKEGFFKALSAGMNLLLAQMTDVVRSMGTAAAEVRAGSEEISRGNTDLSQRTEEQASSLEETASSMEEMTSTVKNNAENAAQANQLASQAREQAERGGAVVGAAVVAMSEINASSKRIADIISVIDEIAFQTNLLALNAAVEAARAGEQGRGFAVVASEVRNLASRSAEAAKEIKTLIKDSVGKVTEGTKLVDESGKVLAEIVTGVKKVTDVMAEIANSSREQASGIEQVNKAIMMMDDATQQNAALVEEAAAAAQALTEQASSLTQLISRYQVGEATHGGVSPAGRMHPVAAATRAVERRSPTRPLTGKKRFNPIGKAIPAPRTAAAPAEEQWKDF